MFSTLSPAVTARRCLERARRPQGDPAARDSDLEFEHTERLADPALRHRFD